MESRHKTDVIIACSAYCPTAKQYEDGVRISYVYTESGNETHDTWARLGNLTVEWGATYPVRYTYDTASRRTSLLTTRDGTTWDTTTWTHDPYTGNCLSKTYADGSTITYTYTPDNLPLRTIYASGKWKENVYDAQRRLCGVIYSSSDMDYELQLDDYGNATNVQAAAGNSWRYDYGFNSKLLAEQYATTGGTRFCASAATNSISRSYDSFDRSIGYALTVNGEPKGSIGYAYDPYGDIIESAGPLADVFSFGFSTKYHDHEIGMIGYQERVYSPGVGRWLNRDPIEEEGGENLYGFCENNPGLYIDNMGTEVYKSITLKRNHLQAISAILYELDKDFPEGDYWGHWWIEFGDESYGWWPSNKVENIKTAMKGVRGDLNGQKSFGGTATKDPHHGDKAEESFNPRRNEKGTMQYGGAKGKKCQCATEEDAKDCIRAFAKNYSGEWRWPGRSCHTFQEEAMSNCCLVR